MNALHTTRFAMLLVLLTLGCASAPEPAPAPPAPTPPETWPADEAFRNTQPPAGPQPEFVMPEAQVFTLDSGTKVYLFENDSLPIINMVLRLDTGAIHDPKGKEGLNALAMSLIDSGPAKLNSFDFEARKADLGLFLSFRGGTHTSSVSLKTLKPNLEAALELTLQTLRQPGLRADDFERIKARNKASLSQRLATPAGIAGRLFRSLIYGAGHPYSKLTTQASLDNITLRDCASFARTISPQRSELFIYGDISADALKSLLNTRLKGWRAPRNARTHKQLALPAPKPRSGNIFFVHVPGAVQSQIFVGHPGPPRVAEDYEATMLLSKILGGSFTSRINMNLREKNGFAYGARAGFQYLRHAGLFSARSSVKSDKTGPALREIQKEIALIRSAPVSEDELQREIRGHVLTMPSWFETSGKTLSTFSSLTFFDLPLDYYSSYRDNVQAVDTDAVLQAARTHLRDNNTTVLVVGDADIVLSDLEALAKDGTFGDDSDVVIHLDPNGRLLKR